MRKAFALTLTSVVLLLTGCSTVDAKLEQTLLTKSGILEHEDYLQYQQYQEAGQLDENGQYIIPDFEEASADNQQQPDGKIHLTFAENRYLNICYYTDASMTTPIDTTSCYMNPGETLYAKVIECINPNSNLYQLAEYRIIEYNDEGEIKKEYTQNAKDGVFEYKIPSDFTGSEMSMIPVGEYLDRNLSMDVYYVDDNGTKHSLGNAGTWSINDNTINGNTATISSIESYTLKFEYDKENYFYVGCEPKCFTKDPSSEGYVEFWEANPTDANMSYAVELHNFLTLSIEFEEEATVKINHNDVSEEIKKNAWTYEKLKYGDSITIETPGNCTITGGDYQHISATKDSIANGFRYTLNVVPTAESNAANVLKETINVVRTFKVTLDTNCNYGTCTYKLNGKNVSGITKIQEGQELTITYKITEEDYTFAEKSEGILGFFHDILKANERTVTISIDETFDGTTIQADEHFEIIKKEE